MQSERIREAFPEQVTAKYSGRETVGREGQGGRGKERKGRDVSGGGSFLCYGEEVRSSQGAQSSKWLKKGVQRR